MNAATSRSRAGWAWLIGVVIVVGLAIAAWFIGERIAHDLVVKTIRDQVITQLSLPEDQQIDVTVEGMVLPQLIAGTLTEVSIVSDDVPLGQVTGDISVEASGVPIRGDAPADEAHGTLALDVDQLQSLLSTIDGFPAESVGLDEPNVTAATELTFFGATVPLGIALTPSAAEGDLVLTPASLTLGSAEISAADLESRFGSVADRLLKDWHVCIADSLPAGVTLTEVSVIGDEIIALVDIDGAIITDPALQENGTCA
ncbi:LmeA family phospholipid-binding protein [Microbacterium terricola]|uniref:DUF2993 domain-containing protein n=1 Tax=Microbacterium terricola TaxID=344163 RepID=A0ABM8DX16_9MICO|nr:DUF2993 domain-containing protein [Microbacterium terricola]UYK39143.1 DUF2993 domain-containing protein [Microbacterium terricola]BDV30142.1 hypothetical protein Microterr_08020 [Microbacterium terricola]